MDSDATPDVTPAGDEPSGIPVAGDGIAMMFGPAKTPDGAYWVSIGVQFGLTAYQFALPLDTADEQADAIAEGIKQAAAEARRQRSGLVIASGTVAHMNGRQAFGNNKRRR